jgi:hypothetical protein
MRSFLSCALVAGLAAAPGCTVQSTSDAGRLDAPGRDVPGRDTASEACTAAAECDDGVACTFDDCVIGNVCEHMPLDSLCEGGQRCDPVRGCSSGCTGPADCNTGINFCDGTFACAGGTCRLAEARSCDDGNPCTVDTCDPTVASGEVMGGCVYTLATGCDGGTGTGDAGVPVCDPFDPVAGYTGAFRVAPVLSLDCTERYNITSFSFAVSGGMLRVTGTPSFGTVLTGPVPTEASFSVSGETACGSYTLSGMFVCATRFSGTFTSSFSGGCAICGGGSMPIVGRI